MFDVGDFSSSSAATLSGSSSLISSFSSKKRKMKNNQRRFSDEQIKSLETMFESETNLEPRKKLQLARELGLQPRQVAIWFQNKRARWKSKQLERDYSLLRSNYNNLASQYESLNKEKQSLVMQLQKLNELMKKSQKEGQCCRQEIGEIGFDRSSENRDNSSKKDMEVRPSLSFDLSEHGIDVISDDDSSINIKTDYLGLEEDNHDLLNMVEPAADSSLTSPENWGSLDNDCELLDQPSTGYQWWDFWS